MMRAALLFLLVLGFLLAITHWGQPEIHPQPAPSPAPGPANGARVQAGRDTAALPPATKPAPNPPSSTAVSLLLSINAAPAESASASDSVDTSARLPASATDDHCPGEPESTGFAWADDAPALDELDSAATFRGAAGLLGQIPAGEVQPDGSPELRLADVLAADPSTPSASAEKPAEPATGTDPLRTKVHAALEFYRPRHLNTLQHSPWEVMHSIVAWGVDTQIRTGGPQGTPAPGIGLLTFNHPCNGQRMFYVSGGKIAAMIGPGLQGHPAQFLAIVAQGKLKNDYPFHVDGKSFTLAELIEYEKSTCEPRTELTFKLIGLAHYLDPDAEWENSHGKWDIARLLREELAQPIRGAACGGTHRLFGISYAPRKRLERGKPIDGAFEKANAYIRQYQDYTFKLQNPDGSFSTEWFNGPGNRSDVDRKLQTTGHILEWLAFSLPQEELKDERTTKAVDFLATLLLNGKDRRWAVGPHGHALHALMIYHQRVYGQPTFAPPDRPEDVAGTE